ncbi:unnamed protein product [[Candida] boidinii]|nr:unnamed protein product [[Candida] boidinii]
MSFFGFDPSGPPGKSKHKNNKNFKKNNKNNSSNSNNNNNNNGNNDDLDTYDFEETYDGLGDNYIEEEDAFNDETFGTEAGANLGKDFDFTGGLKPSNTNPVNDSGLSYAQAANVSDILQPMASLWKLKQS